MNREKKMELAAQAKLVAVVGGKRDSFYAPPQHIDQFADLVIEECAQQVEKLGAEGYGALAIATALRMK